jgi:hypothetical protein
VADERVDGTVSGDIVGFVVRVGDALPFESATRTLAAATNAQPPASPIVGIGAVRLQRHVRRITSVIATGSAM